jgi:hypothetical protein
MKIPVNDKRRLGLAICGSDATYYNPQTMGWEKPFDPTKHLTAFTAFDAANPLMAGVQVADVGDVLTQRSDAFVLMFTLDQTGKPFAPVDVWTMPSPVPNPVFGGWMRNR